MDTIQALVPQLPNNTKAKFQKDKHGHEMWRVRADKIHFIYKVQLKWTENRGYLKHSDTQMFGK